MAKRLLFVNHTSRLGGAEMVLLDVVLGFRGGGAFLFEDGLLRARLARLGIVSIIPKRPSGFSTIKRDRSLLRALPHLGGLARTLWRLRQSARKFDVIYANSQKAFVLAAPASAAARKPLIWHLHDILSPHHFGPAQIKLTISLANLFATRVIVPSKAAADAFVASGGKQALVRIVPNGLDRVPKQAGVYRSDLKLACPFIIGVFSRLSPWKGQEVVLRALVELPDTGCLIVGGALFGEDEYARGLVALAKKLGVSDRVRFVGHRDDVPDLMRIVDVVVHPSTEPEPFGRTLVEAMLVRRPVVAANVGAVSEILEEGRVGILFPPGDHMALAECLRRVERGDAFENIGPAEERALEFYNARRMRNGIRDVIAEVAASRR